MTSEQFKALVKRHLDGDEDGFYSIALQVAARAAQQGHTTFAKDLKKLLDEAKPRTVVPRTRPIPLAQPRGELTGLVAASYPELGLTGMVLDDNTHNALARVLKEHRQRDRLVEHGLMPLHRLLLLGPPGTGKSMTAGALAHDLHVPLLTIQLDQLISRYMGETAAKLRLIFDGLATTSAVVFFDEFDAVGGRRSNTNDVGEARRILNSLLGFLETSPPTALVVCATNHPDLLDSALFRRFDLVVTYSLPDADAAVNLVKRRLKRLNARGVDWRAVGSAASGLSHADIVRATEMAAKTVILDDRRSITTTDLTTSLRSRVTPGG